MRKGWLVVLALLLCLPLIGSAQSINYYPAGGLATLTGTTTATTSSVPLLLPNGSASAPSLSFSNYPTQGLYIDATYLYMKPSNGLVVCSNATCSVQKAYISNGFFMGNSGSLSWTTTDGNPLTTVDLSLRRDAAATLQLGADADTATAQTIKGSDSTGSGTAGGSLTLKGGAGTSGNADGGNLVLAGGALAGSGEYGAVTISDLGTKPTCDAGIRGGFWYDAGGAGVADTFEVCRKDAADAYAWVSVF
jgi:hypothetical protein